MRLTRFLMSRYFRRYIEHEMYEATLKRQWKPYRGWIDQKKENFFFNEHRPWTTEFKQQNAPHKYNPKIPVLPIKQQKIFKGDRVEILVGRDKGKHGIVNCIIKERNWCFIDGLNCEYRMDSSIPDMMPVCARDEKPLLIHSQVKLVDPEDNTPVDVEWRFTEKGNKVRVSTKTGRIIPMPQQSKETEDMVLPSTYPEGPKDTKEKELLDVTFEPQLLSFEEEIMEKLGIKETRKRAKTYWY